MNNDESSKQRKVNAQKLWDFVSMTEVREGRTATMVNRKPVKFSVNWVSFNLVRKSVIECFYLWELHGRNDYG